MPRAGSDRKPKLRPTCWRSFVRPTHVARVVGRHWRPRGKRPGRASGGTPAALHVTDDTARHLRYTSRAKHEADVSLSHRCGAPPGDGCCTPTPTERANPH